MEIIKKVEETCEKYNMISVGDHILVGVSGGPDSVCLLHILASHFKDKFRVKISAAYIDHGLRPEDIPREIEFCKKLCETLSVSFYTLPINVKDFAKSQKMNLQEAARLLRYDALDQISVSIKANKIAVAHNADDQAETVLMRLLRGAGPAGLSGIPPVRKKIIRPLIEVERAEIERYLRENSLSYIVDPSNESLKYMRNRIRYELMPIVKKISPQAIKIISKTAEILREENDYINIAVTKTLMRLMSRKSETTVELFCNPMEVLNIVILRRALRAAIDTVRDLRGINFEHIEQIIKLIKNGKPGDRIYLPRGIRAIKGYSTLTITAEPPKKLSYYEISEPKTIFLKEANLILSFRQIPRAELQNFGDGKTTFYVDKDKIRFPLIIRGRKPGDYFYPFGFGRKKKLQDFFVDEKVPREERDAVPIVESNGEIVCIAGYRLDDRFKIDDNTKECLEIKVIPKV